jgi:hypothetical protein
VSDDKKIVKEKPRQKLKFRDTFTFKVTLVFLGWTIFVQVLFMSVFIFCPQVDSLTIRYSLSDVQATSWASAAIVIYGSLRQEQYLWLRYGIRTGAPGVPGTDKEVSADLIQEMQEYWIEFIRHILDEARGEWKTLSPAEQKEALDDVKAQLRKKIQELKNRENGEIPVPKGRVAE